MDWLISGTIAFGLVAAAFIIAWQFAPKGWRTVVFNVLSGVGVVAGPVLDHPTFRRQPSGCKAYCAVGLNAKAD